MCSSLETRCLAAILSNVVDSLELRSTSESRTTLSYRRFERSIETAATRLYRQEENNAGSRDRRFFSTVNFDNPSVRLHREKHGAWQNFLVLLLLLLLFVIINELLRVHPSDRARPGHHEAGTSSVRDYGEHRSSEFQQMSNGDRRISQRGGRTSNLGSERLIELLRYFRITKSLSLYITFAALFRNAS